MTAHQLERVSATTVPHRRHLSTFVNSTHPVVEMANRSALILGATGAVGRHLLTELLASSEFSQVTEIGRRVTTFQEGDQVLKNEKLRQKVVDLEKIEQEGLADGNFDTVFITCADGAGHVGGADTKEQTWDLSCCGWKRCEI